MHEIKLTDRTSNGTILNRDLQIVKQHLLNNELVLLPSDTCYSLAACAIDETIYKTINRILDRDDEPISIAFPNFLVAQTFAEFDFYTRGLLEKFTPGPITIVCKIISNDSGNRQELRKVVRSKDGTVGVRIPDSSIERDVAGCTMFPITTVAVRDSNKNIVQNYQQALEIVKKGIMKLQNPIGLIGIEGDKFSKKHSTVVKVEGRNLSLVRSGQIDFDEIRKMFGEYPISEVEDWT